MNTTCAERWSPQWLRRIERCRNHRFFGPCAAPGGPRLHRSTPLISEEPSNRGASGPASHGWTQGQAHVCPKIPRRRLLPNRSRSPRSGPLSACALRPGPSLSRGTIRRRRLRDASESLVRLTRASSRRTCMQWLNFTNRDATECCPTSTFACPRRDSNTGPTAYETRGVRPGDPPSPLSCTDSAAQSASCARIRGRRCGLGPA